MNVAADHGEYSYQGLGRLKGRTALITGADSGIGRAVAIAFAREGANVALSYLSEEEEDATETASWIEKAGSKALKIPGDICEENHCKSMIERTVMDLGSLDILVNKRRIPGHPRLHRRIHYGRIRPLLQDERVCNVLALPCSSTADATGKLYHQYDIDPGIRA